MLEIDNFLTASLALDEPTIPLQTSRMTVPLDVVNKFNVETTTESVEQLIARFKDDPSLEQEAFYIINLRTVVNKYQQWIRALPRVKPFYAIKCNPNPAVVKTLAHLGANFDCASKTEIQQILGSGIAPNRIIYANPTKMVSHISYARSSGVEMMTFDNIHELDKISGCYHDAKLVLRIITDDSQSVCRFSTKFGAPLDECRGILSHAKSLNLNVIGISFHVGSGCMSARSFESAIRSAHQVFSWAEDLGYKFSFLDIGGGWPGSDDGIKFDDIALHIRPILDQLFTPDVEIIAEPGRYFVAESHTLAVNVFAKRSMEGEHGKSFLYYINDGVYQSFNCIFFDHCHPKPIVFEPRGRTETFPSTIFGPTCDSMDCIGKDLELPELEVGEWLYFNSMGAYTTSAASPFNGFKSHPTTFYIQ